jgi:hypothetical protein
MRPAILASDDDPRMKTFWRLCLLVLALGLAPAASADAIDGLCPENPDRIERAICADPQLKENRDRMVAALKAAQEQLNAHHATLLADQQEAWRKRAHHLCGEVVDRSRPELDEIGRQCLSIEYYLRTDMLAPMVRKLGPYQFTTIERLESGEATPLDTDSMCVGMICRDLRYPWIAAPATEQTATWNGLTAAWAEATFAKRIDNPPPGMTDLTVELLVTFADPDFISVALGEIWWTAGSPLPTIVIDRSHRWLTANRPLAPADLFDPGRDWATALKQAATAELARQHPTVKIAQTIERQAPDPAYWTLTADALILNLGQGPGKFSTTARIPWRDLKDYLVSPLPLALDVE